MFRLTQHMAALRLAMAPDDRSYAKANDLSGNGTGASHRAIGSHTPIPRMRHCAFAGGVRFCPSPDMVRDVSHLLERVDSQQVQPKAKRSSGQIAEAQA